MRALYVVLSHLVFAVLFPVLVLHRKTRGGFWQRFGFYAPGTVPMGGSPRVWLHGASAGDLLALAPIAVELRRRFPAARILVSTTTDTGRLMATERLAATVDAVFYAPWDLWGATRRAVQALSPSLLVLEYTEIWPNLIHAAHRSGARLALTNGRFAERKLGRYRGLFALAGDPLKHLDALLMREPEEAARALALGARPERVHVTGNTKFDALVQSAAAPEDEALRLALGLAGGDQVWIAGSTHQGEEEQVLEVWQRLRARHPDLKLVLAPRYIDRAARVAALAHKRGIGVALRSQGNAGRHSVVILDTIGELARAYRLATVVFVGGSFTSRGGQNILEPAAQGRPVLFGPQMQNFRDSVALLTGRGGIQVNDAEQLERVLGQLLDRPEEREALGELARSTVRRVAGASARTVDHLAALLTP